MLSISIPIQNSEQQDIVNTHVSAADALLIEGCIANKPLSQAALYKKYYGTLMAICMRYLSNRDNALEVLNNGFLKIFKNLKGYEGKGSFEGWMKRIVYHAVLDYIKQNATYKKQIVFTEFEAGIEADVARKLDAEHLLKLLELLPLTSRTVFNMFAIDGYKHEEIAETLGIAVGTSKWHLSEARKLLKLKIESTN